jgi:hypothetical protein
MGRAYEAEPQQVGDGLYAYPHAKPGPGVDQAPGLVGGDNRCDATLRITAVDAPLTANHGAAPATQSHAVTDHRTARREQLSTSAPLGPTSDQLPGLKISLFPGRS